MSPTCVRQGLPYPVRPYNGWTVTRQKEYRLCECSCKESVVQGRVGGVWGEGAKGIIMVCKTHADGRGRC